jgi:gluconokinase
LIAQHLKCPFIEGDKYHSENSIAKMRSGQPLTDEDRASWLATLAALIYSSTSALIKQQEENTSHFSLVLSCSALKPEYRRTLSGTTAPGTVGFVLIEPTREELQLRLQQRQGHFMPLSLLDSQLSTLNYSENELFMRLKPRLMDNLMPPPEELAAMVVDKLRL